MATKKAASPVPVARNFLLKMKPIVVLNDCKKELEAALLGKATPQTIPSNIKKEPFESDKSIKFFENRSTLEIDKSSDSDHSLKCELCGKGFRKKSYLLQHTNIVHSKKKPFGCKYCLKQFFQRNNLIWHMRSHKTYLPFQCLICGARFQEKELLGNHMKEHIRIAENNCTIISEDYECPEQKGLEEDTGDIEVKFKEDNPSSILSEGTCQISETSENSKPLKKRKLKGFGEPFHPENVTLGNDEWLLGNPVIIKSEESQISENLAKPSKEMEEVKLPTQQILDNDLVIDEGTSGIQTDTMDKNMSDISKTDNLCSNEITLRTKTEASQSDPQNQVQKKCHEGQETKTKPKRKTGYRKSPRAQQRPKLTKEEVAFLKNCPPDTTELNAINRLPPLPETCDSLKGGKLLPRPLMKIASTSAGITLSWDMELLPSHKPVLKYQIYSYSYLEKYESPKIADLKNWNFVGEIDALPLPIGCILTSFKPNYRYFFSVRAIDVYNRFGPFSLPGSLLQVK